MRGREKEKLDAREWERLNGLHFYERLLWRGGARYVAGVDEAGRGPLAGPVVAAAVVLEGELFLPGLDDSKRLTARRRCDLAREIRARASSWAVAFVPPAYITEHDVLAAAFRAMTLALGHLPVTPDHVLVDGRAIPGLELPQTPLVRGDSRSAAIAAASILAKTERDALMELYARVWPEYGFEAHKGYPTPAHRRALARYGPCPIHRLGFRGVGR